MATATKPVTNGHRLISFAELQELPAPYEDVTLPEMGGVTVRLFAVDGIQRATLAGKAAKVADDDLEADLLLDNEIIAATLPGATPESVGKLPAQVIKRLKPSAYRLIGLGAKAIVDAEAQLKGIPSAESGSA